MSDVYLGNPLLKKANTPRKRGNPLKIRPKKVVENISDS